MDLNLAAHLYGRSSNYDEKSGIIEDVFRELGSEGLQRLGNLTGNTLEKLEQYAVLHRFSEDRNRKRRQRHPKQRPRAGDFIEEEFRREHSHWDI